MKELLLGITAATIWTFSTLIDKHYLLTKYEPYELFLFRSPTFLMLGLITTMMLNKDLSVYKKLSKSEFIYVTGSVFFNFIALIIFWYLLIQNKSHYTLSIIQPLYICFVILLSYLLFNESMNEMQFIGFLFVIIGVLIANTYKD